MFVYFFYLAFCEQQAFFNFNFPPKSFSGNPGNAFSNPWRTVLHGVLLPFGRGIRQSLTIIEIVWFPRQRWWTCSPSATVRQTFFSTASCRHRWAFTFASILSCFSPVPKDDQEDAGDWEEKPNLHQCHSHHKTWGKTLPEAQRTHGIETVTGVTKFGHQMVPLALVWNLPTRWHQMYWHTHI